MSNSVANIYAPSVPTTGGVRGPQRMQRFAEEWAAKGWSPLDTLPVRTDLSACMLPLLEAMGWKGNPRHIAEAIPHFIDGIDITSLRNSMAHLGLVSRPVRVRINRIDPRLTPCLFLPDSGAAVVVLGSHADTIRVFHSDSGEYESMPRRRWKGTAYFFTAMETKDEEPKGRAGQSWFRLMIERFRGLVGQILLLSLFLNLLALATPLFVMSVYDKVISTGSKTMLAYFVIGVGIALLSDLVLRAIRARMLAYIGARLDDVLGNEVFRKILDLPPAFTERATVGAQIARVKDFEVVREFFTGPMALVFLELPFAVIFIAVMAMIGGPIAIVPLVMIALFAALGMIMVPVMRRNIARSSRASSRRHEMAVETVSNMRVIKQNRAEQTWLERYRELSAISALRNFNNLQAAALVSNLSHVLMVGAGVATMAYGVTLVFDDVLSVGGLVACMILVWRVLAPLQTGFVSMTRLTQVSSSIHQINNLMRLQGERNPDAMSVPAGAVRGRVTFSRVSLRYSADADPALIGVSFDIKPGEVVAVVGGNGSGKSTLLKLINGLYTPQAGGIRIDNRDIRQVDPVELRQLIGYAPQATEFFYGTLAQNLRLANPLASDDDLRQAADKAGMLSDIEALPDGFETRIGDTDSRQLAASFRQRLNLARAYVKQAPILLLDEPGTGLDQAGDEALMAYLEAAKGVASVFIVTHRPSHIKMADKMMWLESGQIRLFGPAEEVFAKMPKEFV